MLVSLIFAAVTALGVCLAAHPIARALGVIDMPDGRRKLHPRPTPEVGGIAVSVPLIVVLAWLALTTPFQPLFAAIAVTVTAFAVLGLIDDRSHVRPLYRLVASVAAAALLLWLLPAERVAFLRFSFLDVAIFPDAWVAVAFTVLCVVGLQNALNMADGKNGLAVGLLLTWTILMLGYAPEHLMPVLAALIAALGVVFLFNLRGVLFLGDAGTYGLSVAVALLALHTYNVAFDRLHADVVALWFLIPIVDALRLMASRLLRGQSPFAPDRKHLHHVLQAILPAWPAGGRLGLYLALVAVPGALAGFYPELTLLWALLALSAYATIMLASLLPQSRHSRASLSSHPHV